MRVLKWNGAKMVEEVFLSLGSNMGDKADNLLRAIILLSNRGFVIDDVSGIYRTEPIGYTEQDDFLNMVVKGHTPLSPLQLLAVCLETEEELGRVRQMRWGPRSIDVDLLLYGKRHIRTERLQVPHPRLRERAFVLVPLREIAPRCFNSLKVEMPSQKVDLQITRADVKILLKMKGLDAG